jgi:glycosyl hydrolase family 115
MNKTAALFVALALIVQDKEKPFVENKDGLIVIEAEHFHNKVDKDPHKWVAVKEPAGFSGDGAMEARPNDDANNNGDDFADISPRLDYKVKFAKAGKYRVWVRGYGKSDSDNSCHVGLDGKAVETSDRIGDFPTEEWAWYNDTHDNESAMIEIKEPGTRTLNLFMREDGFVADKILLTRDEKYTPKDKGPAESRE